MGLLACFTQATRHQLHSHQCVEWCAQECSTGRISNTMESMDSTLCTKSINILWAKIWQQYTCVDFIPFSNTSPVSPSSLLEMLCVYLIFEVMLTTWSSMSHNRYFFFFISVCKKRYHKYLYSQGLSLLIQGGKRTHRFEWISGAHHLHQTSNVRYIVIERT